LEGGQSEAQEEEEKNAGDEPHQLHKLVPRCFLKHIR
jgi:hypothetical protein